ncbi:MAG: exodeoxyribonuclease VII large subunit [Actinomycetaceae bacterium]|nr:exodeoxyribonuclease VII large subunit [Arcanobacterium sp.]MDD7687434.1 exodeoxyribonuclease VII large subunit [Actinomycetaceae bacterium]MDY5272908.1 exodeoxyribonuclease VII large subunit [Arcanobacterium sp.]
MNPAPPVPIPGDLPQTAGATTADSPWPVRLLSAKIGEYISKMSRMWVEGEVTSIKRRPGAKVQYFQLADLQAQPQITITVKMWSHNLPASVGEGTHVVVLAKPDFWQGNGSFSLFADEIRTRGLGDILAKLAALKAKLAAEGLFSASRKRPLPFLPHRIGLICGRNTEAEKDVVVNSQLRWPDVAFEIRQVLVQGSGAVSAIITALAQLDADPEVDVIVLARGGGSPEDLLPFSDETLVRAVAAAHTPIVSAIGHEADNPLVDFVADVRASTPTDAARALVPDVSEERRLLAADLERGRRAIYNRLHLASADIAQLRGHPALANPERSIDARYEDVSQLIAWGRTHIGAALDAHAHAVTSELTQLRTLSPLSTLKRGYSILRSTDGNIVSSVRETSKGARLQALMRDGQVAIRVEDTSEGEIAQ